VNEAIDALLMMHQPIASIDRHTLATQSEPTCITTITMSSKPFVSLFWRVTLLLAIFVGSSAFSLPAQQIISPSLQVACFRQVVLSPRCVNDNRSLLRSLRVTRSDIGAEEVKKSKKYVKAIDNKHLPPIQSIISVAVASRRLSFLVFSIALVNFVRSKILKIPKSEKFMFDECPWPFTAAHDPKKFIKDGKTHIVAVWAVLCQLWSLFNKTRIVA